MYSRGVFRFVGLLVCPNGPRYPGFSARHEKLLATLNRGLPPLADAGATIAAPAQAKIAAFTTLFGTRHIQPGIGTPPIPLYPIMAVPFPPERATSARVIC